jgi:superfamily I DNA/RNA helicase
MLLTPQQQNIVDTAGKHDLNFLKINAFAGTGKTTVLQALTETYSDKTFLYLVFNSAMSAEAKKRFGDNTKVCTINSLAYNAVRDDIKLYSLRENYKVIEIKTLYNISEYAVALLAIRLFDAFCNSAYKDINTKIIKQLIYENAEYTIIFKKNKPSINKITNVILNMWNDMYYQKLDIVHNFYLKYFHLAIEKLKNKFNYDYVLLDESQDTNAITLDIFNNLNGKKIIVGDQYQQIYGFRGTINAMDSFDNKGKTLYLSHTFRFNDNIANKANYLLNIILNEPEKIISHFPDKTGTIKTRCHLTRTNSGIIELFTKYHEEGKIVKTIRKPDEIFKLPLSLYYFISDRYKNKHKIEVKYLFNFRGRAEIKEYAEEAGDIEMITALRIVEQYWDEIIDIFEQAKINRRKRKIDMFLGTAHTCKGLEWDEVYIHDDFPCLIDRISQVAKSIEEFHQKIHDKDNRLQSSIQKVIEEINLYYVAITRGIYKVHLTLPNSSIFDKTIEELDSMLQETKEN